MVPAVGSKARMLTNLYSNILFQIEGGDAMSAGENEQRETVLLLCLERCLQNFSRLAMQKGNPHRLMRAVWAG